MYRLLAKHILQLHDKGIQKYGGEYGVREQGTFDMLCEAPYQTMFGEDLYPSVFDKSAKLLEGFCTHQVFYDGNKRTGLLAMNALLKLNGYELTITNDKMYQFTLDVSNNHYDLSTISQYLEQHVRKTIHKEYESEQEIKQEIENIWEREE